MTAQTLLLRLGAGEPLALALDLPRTERSLESTSGRLGATADKADLTNTVNIGFDYVR